MAITRFAMKPRTMSGAQSATRAVAYLTREGAYAPAQREVGYLVRETEATRTRDDLVWQATYNLPTWADNDPYRFFEAAAAYERTNGRWAITLEVALPKELSRQEQLALAHDFVHSQLPDKPCLVVMHEPRTPDGLQPHIHVLFSPRGNDGIARTAAQYFRRAHPAHPARGGAPKDPFWSQRQCPSRVRRAYTDLVNASLERAGHEVRLDPRSLVARGIARDAEGKDAWKADGDVTRARVRAQRTQTLAEEQRLAHEHWEARKQVLGITHVHDVSREELVERTRAWTRNFQPGKQLTLDDLRTREQDLSRTQRDLEEAMARLHVEIRAAERDELEGREPSFADADKTARVVAAAERHLAAQASTPGREQRLSVDLDLPEEDTPQGGLHVRLRVHDYERGWER
jgi:hypothetical protein